MRWRDSLRPVPMRRVALLSPAETARDLLVRVADAGAVQFDTPSSSDEVAGTATIAMHRIGVVAAEQRLALVPPDPDWCREHGRLDLVAGETQLERVLSSGVRHGSVVGFVGWTRADAAPHLRALVAPVGGAVVALQRPQGVQPPTLLARDSAGSAFAPLVRTYATPPYRDLDPSLLAGIAYVAMFGMMFADLGHGALLLGAALIVRLGHRRCLERLRTAWVLIAGSGLSSMFFGALYGEFFGPTHALPVIWLDPLDEPVPLLLAAIAVGAVFLAGAYVLGTVNRLREGGWRVAVYAPSGLAGGGIYIGIGVVSAGVYFQLPAVVAVGTAISGLFAALVLIGFFTDAGGGASGAGQAGIELFDLVLRLGSNLVSFSRLAAFGLTHAALGQVVWQATTGAARHGGLAVALAVLVFAAGNALTFSLEALIAAIQALRLEYYELFSRVFVSEGEPFQPWQLPIERTEFVQPAPVEA